MTVKLFARLRELVGSGELTVDVPAGATVRDVWTALVAAHPAAAVYERSMSCAVNLDYARMTAPVAEGDDVAFLPPVSGGSGRRVETVG
ncbi:MAG: molybdopterin converting factor subunit 1 [Vicinamibacterales bacterium]